MQLAVDRRTTGSYAAFFLIMLGLVWSVTGCGSGTATTEPAVEHIEPDAEIGTSMATVVGDVPLAHTALLLPVNSSGAVVSGSGLEPQVNQVLDNLQTALAEVDAGFSDLVKLHVYVTRDSASAVVSRILGERFPDDARPAVAFVAGRLPSPDARVAMDAVAVTPRAHEDVRYYHADGLPGADGRGHVGVLPPGGKVFISGQAAEGNLAEATRGTMEGLHATLAYLGLSADDVVQVKAFANPIVEADSMEAVIADYYRNKPTPPVVSVEWTNSSLPVEIELVASRDRKRSADEGQQPVRYITPPGMSSFSTFSRVTDVRAGGLMYVSGLYGEAGQDAEGQVRRIFDTLDRLVKKAGSDFDNLAKATYYYSTGEASSALNDIRQEFYDPDRPPASSKIAVRNVGKPGTTVTFDMIGAITSPE